MRLYVYIQNMAPRKIFKPKRDEETAAWRKLHNEEIIFTPHPILLGRSRTTRWAGYVTRVGARKRAYKVLVGRSEGRRQLGRTGRRWEDNIKIDISSSSVICQTTGPKPLP